MTTYRDISYFDDVPWMWVGALDTLWAASGVGEQLTRVLKSCCDEEENAPVSDKRVFWT